MKTIFALLILVSTATYGQVGTPKGLEGYYNTTIESPNYYVKCQLGTVEFSMDMNDIIDKQVSAIRFEAIWSEFDRIIKLNHVDTTKIVYSMPNGFEIKDSSRYDYCMQGLINAFNDVVKTGRYASTLWSSDYKDKDDIMSFAYIFFKDGFKYVIGVFDDMYFLTVSTQDSTYVNKFINDKSTSKFIVK